MSNSEMYMQLLSEEWFPLYIIGTHDFYLDENNGCFFFKTASLLSIENETFKKQYKRLTKFENIPFMTEPKSERYKFYDLMEILYSINCTAINFIEKDNIISLPVIFPDQIKYKHYNTYVKKMCLNLKITHKKAYLNEFKGQSFICAVKIFDRKLKEYPRILYGYAQINSKIYYLLFTSLIEFEKWNQTQNNEFCPIKTNIKDFSIIIKEHGLFIDAMTTRLILEHKYIENICK